ncbi:VPS10 domain-containing protein [Flagellimonas aequoris]|uniref:Glycosyl hydrolase n=1 Tax=Flagellimonas aequoris TaxID=2306997 RepID=A0A418NBR4_9FLAO|nr:glycosyl hydrolase [Allomuricauda aequoris]RIV73197.1 glycosyl hydrolase [Allomuricauda aequoris]TXK07010.1 glycosyl hydrolase [Allomuricauda aequoris]
MKPRLLLLCALLLAIYPSRAQKRNKKSDTPAVVVNDSLFPGLKWRNIGPYRGGRSVTSTGVVGQPHTYYMGSTGGGIYKTTDDGINWENISDGFLKTGTVGDIAVSETNPNLVLVGMGEHPARGVMTSMGDGVYKSTDAGKTWKHIGLDKTRHIGDVIIDPTNPDILFVAAQGAQYGPSEDRGVYRSLNGGETWEKVLYVDENTGASSLSMDMNNPMILYAAMWQHRRYPWTMESGGASSGLYKSTDGGATWTKMDKGIPKEFGKSGISVSRANSDIVYVVLEAEGEKGGVYKSVDAGKTWQQTSKDRINIARSWYYMEIFADTQDENVVYVLNAPVTKSIDGGKTFAPLSTPHGDNHDLWIHPHDNKIMINSNDGGANISNNGGKSWSSQENQATSQFYRVITDNLVPYHVYGGQQDNTSVAIASRTHDDGIDWKDWYAVSGCESAYLAFDPNNPDFIYGGCYQGIIEKWVRASQEAKPIKEYPELGLSKVPKDFKFRYNWNAPIISSPHDPNTIYHAGNVVFKTQDGGNTWEVVSPDLTRNDPEKQGPGGGPYTNEAAGGENYNTLMYLVESPHEKGVLYAGSDDGLVHITKNGGQSWENITPPNLKESIINSIEVSPHDPATAYMVAMRYKFMDLDTYIFKTSDYGKTWTRITQGIDGEHNFARVVREDPKQKGLLYAGTETGLFVSLDDGQHWQPLQLNLPLVPINDLAIHDNDLIAATAGRSFWILDDLGAIQTSLNPATKLSIVTPKPSYRIFNGSTDKSVQGLGQNPKSGVTFDYYLPKKLDSTELKLEVLSGGKVIRAITNQAPKDFKSWPGGPSKPAVLPSLKGYNRFTWDFSRESVIPVDQVFAYGGYQGARVAPGTYTLKLSIGDETVETNAVVLADPNVEGTPADYAEQQSVLVKIDETINSMHKGVNQIRKAKNQLKTYKDLLKDNEKAKGLLENGDKLLERITTWEEKLIQPNQKTFQDVINFRNQLNAEFMHLKGFVDVAEPKVTNGAKERLRDLLAQWKTYEDEKNAIVNDGMKAYNDMFKSLEIPAIILSEE